VHISKSELKFLRSLSQKKVRQREGKFLIEGWKSLNDALNSDFHIDLVAMTQRYAEDSGYQSFIRDINSRKVELKELTDRELNQISDAVHAQGVVGLVRQRKASLDGIDLANAALVVLADRIADPGNLGTVIRTCDWFAADALILSEGCVELHNEKVVRSTAGSIFHIPVIENVETDTVLARLKKQGFWIVATAGDARESYTSAIYKERNVIIFSNEAHGVDQQTRRLADAVVTIPRRGKAESLNVGVACGIILSHLRKEG